MSEALTQDRMDAFARLALLRNAIANVAPGDEELGVIDDLSTKLHARQYVVAVVGEFNRGKSSLINALLGMNVLPADITPTTATINRVVYSDIPFSRLRMRDGREEEIPIAMLKGRVTKLSEESSSVAAQVDEAVIGYPTVFCRNNISILDTPGLNESDEMDALTFERAQQADALIYAIHALVPFSISEASAVCRLLEAPNIRHMIFTVGFIDQVDPAQHERMLELIRKRIVKLTSEGIDADSSIDAAEAERRKAIVREAEVLGISAKMALDAFVNGSMEQLNASGVERYKTQLMTRLTAQQDEWFSYEIVPYLERFSAVFDGAAGRSLGALDGRIRDAEEALSVAQDRLNGFPAKVSSAFERMRSGVIGAIGTEAACTEQLRDVIKKKLREEVPEGTLVNAASSGTGGGLVGWVKQKAKASGIYREAGDPRIDGVRTGFNLAKLAAVLDWFPTVNQRAAELYAEPLELFARTDAEVSSCARKAAAALRTGDEIPQTLIAKPLSGELTLLGGGDDAKIRALQPGNLTVGSIEGIVQHLAKTISAALYGCIRRRFSEITSAGAQVANDFQRTGRELMARMNPALEQLRGERAALESQIESVKKFLMSSEETPENKISEEAAQEGTEAETDASKD